MIKAEEPIIFSAPSFIAKLWSMVNNPDYEDIICWTEDGTSFVIKNKEVFTFDLLPCFFKHNNLSSFIRQLNKYGFKKTHSVDNSELEFSHEYFCRDNPLLLAEIKRKHNTEVKPSVSDDAISDLLGKVKHLKKSQEMFQSKINMMEKETETLCKETANLKRKQQAQQKIINNIMTFLVNMMSQNEQEGGTPVIFSNAHSNINKNIMAITHSPHNEDQQITAQDMTQREIISNAEDSNIVNYIIDNENEMLIEEPGSPIIDSLAEQNAFLDAMNEGQEALSTDKVAMNTGESPLTYIAIPDGDFQMGNTEPDSVLNPPLDEMVVSDANSVGETFITTDDLDFDKLLILNAAGSPSRTISQSPPEQPGISQAQLSQPSPPVIVKKELGEHVNEIESNLTVLKDLMSSTDLNLDVSEVVQLFSPEEIKSIVEASNDFQCDDNMGAD